MSPVFTPATLAARWGCSRRHVYALIDAGKIEAFRLGARRGVRIRAEVVETWEKNGGSTALGRTGSGNSTGGPSSGGGTPKGSRSAESFASLALPK